MNPQVRRILVALDAGSDAPPSLASAVALAARLEAELEGLFIEDLDLLRSAALPFVRRINLLTGESESFEVHHAEHELRRLAAEVQQRLAQEAERHRVRWRFRIVRGHVADSVARAAGDADLVVVAVAGPTLPGRWRIANEGPAAAERVDRPVLFLPHGAGLDGPVAAVLDDSPDTARVLDWALRLASADSGELEVLAVAPDRGRAAALAEAARAELGRRGVRSVPDGEAVGQGTNRLLARVWTMVAATIDGLLATGPGPRERPGLLILSARSPLLAGPDAVRTISRLPLPALVLR
jgi:hypothetical protein